MTAERRSDDPIDGSLHFFLSKIEELKAGLEPEVLAGWYQVILEDARLMCPDEELRKSLDVVQNDLLPMKFEFHASRRAVPFVLAAIEKHLPAMTIASRGYFEKLEEMIVEQMRKLGYKPSFTPEDLEELR